mgnify:CR=1 FL=1
MNTLTLTQWRTESTLTKAARTLHKNKTLIQMMGVLKNELPTNRTLPAMGASATDFAYAYGVEVGFRQCIATLEAMAIDAPVTTEPEATFEKPKE